MASRYERKLFLAHSIYHAFSRGVNKADIFHSPEDYDFFTESLMLYLLPKEELIEHLYKQGYSQKKILHLSSKVAHLKNYANEVSLIAYCLMPNHFHLLLEQGKKTSMTNFMKSLLIRYSMYYSRKYEHIGPLFQGRYKAINVLSETYFRIVFNYIHENPRSLQSFHNNPQDYPWSSMRGYNGDNAQQSWIKTRSF